MSFNGWRAGKLSDIAIITMGQSPKGEFCNNDGSGEPLLNGPTEFGTHNPYPTQFTTDIKKSAKKGDLLFCVRGSTTGRMNWADRKYAIGRGIASISPQKDKTEHFIKAIIETKLPVLLQSATGSTFPNVSRGMLTDMSINIPTYEEIISINKILSDLDNKIEVNNKINKRLEEMAQAIFKQWFVDFEFPNKEGKPYKSSGGEMVESEPGMIPNGWAVITLDKIADIKTTAVKPQDNKGELYEHYSIPAFDKNRYPVFEEGSSIKSNKYKVYENSILISKLNPDTKRMWKPLVLTDNAICSTEFINYVPKEKILEPLIHSLIDSEKFTEYLNQHTTGSTGSRQRANPKSTYDYKFAMVRDTEILELFCKSIKSINIKIRNNLIEINKLTTLRDTLLPKLMSGEIRVPLEK